MPVFKITVDGVAQYAEWLVALMRDGVLKFGSVGLSVSGNTSPRIQWTGDHVQLSWPDGTAEIMLPGLPDPNIDIIRVYPDRAQVELSVGPRVDVRFRA